MVSGTTSSYEAIVDTRTDQRNFTEQEKSAIGLSSSGVQNRTQVIYDENVCLNHNC